MSCNLRVPNFDYAIAVGICTLAMLVGLRVAVTWMRSAARRRTDAMLLGMAEPEGAPEGNKSAASLVGSADDNDAHNSETDG